MGNPLVRYQIRGAVAADEPALLALARELNTVNLPHDEDHVRGLLRAAERSFNGELEDLWHRRYVFVLEDLLEQRLPGTSMIVAQLGRLDAPYIYFDVFSEDKYSRDIARHFRHTVMRLGFTYDGPTEIGGLVVAPADRRSPHRLGQLISYVRFLYIATHRDRFRDEILAELLPPLEPDGTSHLWEALGRRFTGMTYTDADRLSSENKDFIADLFPRGTIYAALLSQEAQGVIGKVGEQTRGVEKLLRRIGFRHTERVDPFDGGPHFAAATDEITLIRQTVTLPLGPPLDTAEGPTRSLVAIDLPAAPHFKAIVAPAEVDAGQLRIPTWASEHLDITAGTPAFCLPLHPKGPA